MGDLSTLDGRALTPVRRFDALQSASWRNRLGRRGLKELTDWREFLLQAEARRVAKCGHFLWIDAPEECLTAVRGFLDRTNAGAA